MPQPSPYIRTYDFTDYQEDFPTQPLPASPLDAQLDLISIFSQLITARLALIQRDDGELANQSVGADQLDGELIALLGNAKIWATAQTYAVGDVVFYNNAIYKALVAHTSTVFATDLGAGKWALIIDYSAMVFAGTSVTSLTVGTGTKVFATQLGKNFQAGTFVLIVSDASPATTYMHGQVVSYVGTALTVNVTSFGGSGAHADWTIHVSGARGDVGLGTPAILAGDARKVLHVNNGETTNEYIRMLGFKGTSIASAGTTAIDRADSDFISITGTTTITSFGAADASTVRDHVWLQFDGILTLTHNAVSLILPGAADIITQAGDVAECVRISAGNWKVVNYMRADGNPIGTNIGQASNLFFHRNFR